MDYTSTIVILIIVVCFTVLLLQQYDCHSRMVYWNDKGFFINSWNSDVHNWVMCQYPPIESNGDND